ncbi:MAG: hypothetical protein N3E40_00115 [Dehalococcoidia bacterium]|nr:hypothetical protein [Dehalococcoidia bacterium]
MAERFSDGTKWTVREMLEYALTDCPDQFTKAVLILLDDRNGSYNTGYYQAGMRVSQMVGLLEIVKQQFIDTMLLDYDDELAHF